jgi:hypothetical protein
VTWLISNWRVVSMVLLMSLIACGISWRAGWSAHADHINSLAAEKKKRAEQAIKPTEAKAATASNQGKIIYKTIYRDVVKYVQDPNRTVCKFDDNAVQLRQRAIDATNNIAGFDDRPVQGK